MDELTESDLRYAIELSTYYAQTQYMFTSLRLEEELESDLAKRTDNLLLALAILQKLTAKVLAKTALELKHRNAT